MTHFKNALIFTPEFAFRPGCFSAEKGRFARVLGDEGPGAIDLHGARVIPGLVDIHTHGNSGSDFSDGDEAGLRRMAAYNARHGVTAFAPTSMTLPYDALERAFHLARIVAHHPRPGEARVVGVHMEGPFLSESRKGAQNANYLQSPAVDAFARLDAACGGLVKIVDLAPELPGAVEFAARTSRACTVSIAHTDADYDQTRAVLDAGARHLTHLFNAMPGMGHRAPGPIGAAAEREDVMAELICDGVHVHPSAVRLAFRLFPGRICLVSDSIRACGMPEGTYDLGGQQVYIHGRRATLAGGALAGSCADLFTCMTTAISFGVPAEEAVRAATWNPAYQVGALDELGSIQDGKRADFVVCDEDLQIQAVYIGGERV